MKIVIVGLCPPCLVCAEQTWPSCAEQRESGTSQRELLASTAGRQGSVCQAAGSTAQTTPEHYIMIVTTPSGPLQTYQTFIQRMVLSLYPLKQPHCVLGYLFERTKQKVKITIFLFPINLKCKFTEKLLKTCQNNNGG